LGGRLGRSKDREGGGAKTVDDACGQRAFRPDDRYIGTLGFGQLEERPDVVSTDLHAPADLGNARVSRRRDQLERLVVTGELPGERVLAAPAADEEDLHFGRPRTA
jgi:hypothetical protein